MRAQRLQHAHRERDLLQRVALIAVEPPLHRHHAAAAQRANEQAARVRLDVEPRIAAIDIGSNSIRQIIADVGRNGSIRIVDEMKAAPRLGAGLSETGALGEDGVFYATEILLKCPSRYQESVPDQAVKSGT